MEYRLGRDWETIAHLHYWQDKEVSQLQMTLMSSFENYMYYSFKQRWNVAPTRVQYDMGRYLEGTIKGDDVGHLRGVMAFRGATKTAITSCFSSWVMLLDPRVSVKVVAGKDDLAKQIIKECRIWFDTVDILEENLHPSLNRGSASMMDNYEKFNIPGNPGGKDASFSAVAIVGNLTGSRAHILIMDDIEHPSNCDTPQKREKLKAYDSEANNILFDPQACSDSHILYDGFKPFKVYLGTPHHEESIYYFKMTHGYKFRVWPARYPNAEYMKSIGHLIAPMLLEDIEKDPSITTGFGMDFKQGQVVDPRRQSEESVIQKEKELGTSGFAKNYMLDVSMQSVDMYPLKVTDLIVADLDTESARATYMGEREPYYALPDLPCVGLPGDIFYRPSFMAPEVYKYDNIVMCIDPSGRGKDETGYAVVAVLNGNFFLLANGGLAAYAEGYSDAVLQKLVDIAKQFSVKAMIIESNFGDGIFLKSITPFVNKTYPCELLEERASTQKEVRIIETLEPIMTRRKLIVARSVIEKDYRDIPLTAPETERPSYRLIYQLSRITRARGCIAHDDRLDALEGAVRYLIDTLALDQEKQAGRKFEEMLQEYCNGGIFNIGTGTVNSMSFKGKTFF